MPRRPSSRPDSNSDTTAIQLEMLLRLVDESYLGQAWHGPTLRGSLRGVSQEQAQWRPQPERHNIWEIALHAAYWKYTVRRRLLNEKRGSFALKGSNWFPRPGESAHSWQSDLSLLEETHQSMRAVIADLKVRSLDDGVHGAKVSYEQLIRGIAQHDVYHAGQIQLLKRMQPRKTRKTRK